VPTKHSPRMPTLRPQGLRVASSVEDGFPYKDGLVSYVVVTRDGEISNPRYVDDRRAAARTLRDGEAQVFCVWPGQYRSDLFVIDDANEFFNAYPSR
jgi:hypothetical protein